MKSLQLCLNTEIERRRATTILLFLGRAFSLSCLRLGGDRTWLRMLVLFLSLSCVLVGGVVLVILFVWPVDEQLLLQ